MITKINFHRYTTRMYNLNYTFRKILNFLILFLLNRISGLTRVVLDLKIWEKIRTTYEDDPIIKRTMALNRYAYIFFADLFFPFSSLAVIRHHDRTYTFHACIIYVSRSSRYCPRELVPRLPPTVPILSFPTSSLQTVRNAIQ